MHAANRIVEEVEKAYLGNTAAIRKILLALLAGGHVLLEDIPGVGKTTLANAFSQALGLRCNRVQFTPDVLPTDITGFSIYKKETGTMEYQAGAALCNLLMADELNRAPSRTQAALLEAMEEERVTVDGESHRLPQPFMVIATQNPTGSAGTQLLPESQMDRFMLRLSLGYPPPESEREMLRRKQDGEKFEVRPVCSAGEVQQLKLAARQVYVAPPIYKYIVALTGATRQHPLVAQGASPRCSVALLALGQASAFMAGRSFVLPTDIQAVFEDCTAHRLVLSPTAHQQQKNGSALLQDILRQVPAPSPEDTP
ncbi:MAG: AAA family ATPase [Oscillospiraceae bacterium]